MPFPHFGGSLLSGDWAVPRILVVDDSLSDLSSASGQIERALPDAHVVQCADGGAALEANERRQADLIVTDLQVPDVNGLELLEELRGQGSTAPIVLITGEGDDEVTMQALLAGATSYIPKSALSAYLVGTVRSVLQLSRRRRAARRVMHNLIRHEQDFCFGNDVTLVTPFIEIIQELLAGAAGFDSSATIRTGMALHEALTNAIYHGNLELDSDLRQVDERVFHALCETRRLISPYCERQIHVTVGIDERQARFTIRDEGPGFDSRAALALLDNGDLDLDRVGGRGLLLIRSFVDELSFNSAGNEIHMVKSLATGADAQASETAAPACC
jgi:DNA-binding response OmpR family regulator